MNAITNQKQDDQEALWNGTAGQAWVAVQATLDRAFRPFEDLLAQAIPAASQNHVLDIGCGTGGTTLAVARRIGAGGHCTGVDISGPMIAAARTRAQRQNVDASFVQADAGGHPFTPQSFDALVSRFGVMFFDDPVGAFSNLRRAVRPGARLRFLAWRDASENSFMTAAEHAAAPLLPALPARQPGAPGQFAFADRDRVFSILRQNGWTNIAIQPIDVVCSFPEEELVQYLTYMGPVGRLLQQADSQTRDRVLAAIRPAFDPYLRGSEVAFSAACWIADAWA
jgi:SAM-dependent methyltransferase